MRHATARGMAIALTAVAAPVWAAAGSSLVEAVRANQSKEAIKLIRQGADVNASDSRGYTPLMWAASWGEGELAAVLIKRGARINTPAADGATAWSIAVTNGHRPVAEALMKAGANCRALDPDWDPQQAAKDPVTIGSVNRAIRLGEPLLDAAAAGNVAELKKLLAQDAPVGYVRRSREMAPTALMIAAARADVEAVKALLRAGAIASNDHINGGSPLDSVKQAPDSEAKREVIRLLKEKAGGAAVSPKENDQASGAKLRQVLERLNDAASALPATAVRARILESATWLLNASGRYEGISENYITELERAAQILEHPPGQQTDLILGDVADDLALKVEHCRKLGIGMGGKVRILVTTKQGDQAVNGWQVLYLPKILQHAKGVTPDLIPVWSSPAREEIEPGRYLVWARNPATKRASDPIVVSISGEEVIAIDLAVP
jgi:ankyrin repeat protein